jgi:MFS family permease
MTTIVTGGRVHRLYTVVIFTVLAALDNVAIGLVPPLITPISGQLGVGEGAVSAAVAISFIVSAVAAVGWAYVGDRLYRKPLLMIGTLLWALGTFAATYADSFVSFLAALVVAAIGLGAVGSVGFSVVTDLIAPRRRGLVMSFWGLSQGVGTLAGTLVAGLLGGSDWRRPFYVVAAIGVAATLAYLFTYSIPRGASEPQLKAAIAAGEYDHRIDPSDLGRILRRRTNVWLILQGFTAQLVFGSLVLLPRLFQAKAEQIGYSTGTTIAIGSVYAVLFQLGGVLSIVGGLAGDRLQRRNPGGRAMVASVGILAAIPFYMVLFFVPLRLDVPDGASSGAVVAAVLASIVTQPVMALSFVTALLALALTSANSPNWFALIAEVNPPEHRGTVYSLGNLVNGLGRAAGTGLVSAVFRALERSLPPPMNFVIGLAAFQVFFIPTGIMYWLASRTSPGDIQSVQDMLDARSHQSEHPAVT